MARKSEWIKQRNSAPARRERAGGNARAQVAQRARSAGRFDRRELLIAAALAAVTLAVYGQVINHQFINYDDDVFIRDNRMVADGLTLKGIAWAFSTFFDSNWHPLAWISHMVDSEIFGPGAGGPLLVNALLHVGNTLLIFLFLKRITGASWPSAMVAALFALHPLHVESVAWAIERKDTLSTFFGLLSLLAYARYAKAPSAKQYALVALWLCLGLMSKAMLVTWPFIMLLLDYWPLRRLHWQPAEGIRRFAASWIPLIREKLPLFGLVMGSMVVTYLAQLYGGSAEPVVEASFPWRLANALVSYGKYLFLTFWPAGLAIYYPLSPTGVPSWQIITASVLLLAITALVITQATKRCYLIMGWLWFVGALIPVIGLVQVGAAPAMADRYHYIPSIGLFVAIVFGLADLAMAWRIGRDGIAIGSAIVLLTLGWLTALQVSRWRDSVTLFEHALSVTSDNVIVHNNLGCLLDQQGKYTEAIPHFAEALRVKSTHLHALTNMGLTLRKLGKATEAIGFYNRAVAVKPDYATAHWGLGLALADEGKHDDAQQEFAKAAVFGPPNFDARMDLGLMFTRQNKLSEAASHLNEAVRLKPNSAEANNNLGLVLLMAGEPGKSLPYFSKALRLKPDFALARENARRAQREIKMRQ